jgi:hypothetical protein
MQIVKHVCREWKAASDTQEGRVRVLVLPHDNKSHVSKRVLVQMSEQQWNEKVDKWSKQLTALHVRYDCFEYPDAWARVKQLVAASSSRLEILVIRGTVPMGTKVSWSSMPKLREFNTGMHSHLTAPTDWLIAVAPKLRILECSIDQPIVFESTTLRELCVGVHGNGVGNEMVTSLVRCPNLTCVDWYQPNVDWTSLDAKSLSKFDHFGFGRGGRQAVLFNRRQGRLILDTLDQCRLLMPPDFPLVETLTFYTINFKASVFNPTGFPNLHTLKLHFLPFLPGQEADWDDLSRLLASSKTKLRNVFPLFSTFIFKRNLVRLDKLLRDVVPECSMRLTTMDGLEQSFAASLKSLAQPTATATA